MMKMIGMKRIAIGDGERGLLYRNRRFDRVLAPGVTWLWDPFVRSDLRVADVTPQSAAAAAGIRRGDVIESFDGEEVQSADDLGELVSQADPGRHEIRVTRDQAHPTVRVKLK